MVEGGIDNLTMEQYLALTRENQAPGVVKPEIGGNVNFEIKSQFMRELKEDTFSGNKNDDAKEHVERVLDIVSLFNIFGVSHDVVMMRVFPITLTGAAKRWTANQLEEICNFKLEGDETLYQAWERYNDLLYKCLTHDINNHQKVNIFSKGLRAMNRQLLDSQWPIPGMTHVQALTAIQTMADHSQKWHDGASSINIESSSSSEGIAAIVNKLENVGQDMKKRKENVHTIQVGCQICEGAHLVKDCPFYEEIKSMEEIKYEEFGRPFSINNRNDKRFNKGGYDHPSSGERRPSLTEIIHKYIEEASKRHTEQDEWLKKFYISKKASREAHYKIIQGLETNVKTLANEVEGRTNNGKFEECKAICSEDGLPLYTPFYYSPEEIEYFSANSGFSDNEKQETDDSGMAEALAALKATLKKKREEPKKEKHNINYYVDHYEPSIPFPRRLEQHEEESLVHQTIESLKKIKINHPLLNDIRQTDNYAKQMNELVENKPRTNDEKEIKMNPRKLDFKNALADLGISISIMPFSMYKHIVILDMVEDIQMPIIIGRPLLATTHAKESYKEIVYKLTEVEKEKYSAPQEKKVHWCKAILQENENEHQYWASCNPNSNICDGGDLPINVEKHYYKSNNDNKREELEWENLSLNDWMRIRYEKVCKMIGERILKDYWRKRFRDEEYDLEENLEDPKECGEDKANTILGVIHDKLNNDWFNNTSEDEDDLEGILYYLKPRSYDEAYNKRRCKLLGMTYEEPTPIIIKKAKVTRYTVGPGDCRSFTYI
ncbi:hypothetical protein Tco_0993047 [Tanacetum coccineum]|uniref:Retrotransposon gag domain-containing protein n=1 Tax=Tanacetum coccineum TaxID=301880 RepID=A0ABQ5F4I5_9ASTR